MAKIVIDCADPNDFTKVVESAERAAGSCTITYAKQHLEMVKAGTSRGVSESARIISDDSDDTPQAARRKIQRGLCEIAHDGQQESKPLEIGAGRPSKSIERFLNKAKSLARLAEKIKKEPDYEARKQELLKAAAATINVLTETREDVKWV